MSSKEYVPWVEKYRPNNIESIVLSDVNRTIIDSIIKLNYFPNILYMVHLVQEKQQQSLIYSQIS